ncbi:MAG: hypothetical protein ABL921_18740 [Pirellula sp.]
MKDPIANTSASEMRTSMLGMAHASQMGGTILHRAPIKIEWILPKDGKEPV